ncbi:MAG: hypothetical protein KAJ33_06110 [Thermoplasmata archaeon]|nr:hypothetical protein [Thermoplasmata archaeon]
MSYTTPEKVRNLLPDLLMAYDYLGMSDSGTNLTLNNSAFAVPTILQDATELAITTDYTFVQPRTLKLNTAADGENYTAHVHVAFPDSQLTEFIGQSDRIIDNEFANQTLPDADYLDDWSQWLTAWKIKLITAKGDPDLIAESLVYKNMAMDAIEDYKAGTLRGTFSDTQVTRDDRTPVPDFSLDQSTTARYPL